MRKLRSAACVAVALGLAAMAVPPAAAEGQTIASGTFRGTNGHVASGGISVHKTAAGIVVVLDADFAFDGAPDPKLGFGKNGYDAAAMFAPLKANKGKQDYRIPAAIDPEKYDEIWIWCERYAVSLGVAKLK